MAFLNLKISCPNDCCFRFFEGIDWEVKSVYTEMVFGSTQLSKFMDPTWGLPGSCRSQMGPMLGPYTLLSGVLLQRRLLNGSALGYVHVYAYTVYPKKYAHGFCFAALCCGYTLTDFPISIRLTSLALWQSNDCHSGSKATLMNMDKYFMWIHYERLHNHNKAKHNKTVCIFLGMHCILGIRSFAKHYDKTSYGMLKRHQKSVQKKFVEESTMFAVCLFCYELCLFYLEII